MMLFAVSIPFTMLKIKRKDLVCLENIQMICGENMKMIHFKAVTGPPGKLK